MKAALLFLLAGVLVTQAQLSRLEAISMIETGDNDTMVGAAGEVSRYQMMPRVWKQYSSSEAFADPAVSSQVAQRHVDWLESFFRKRAGREMTEFDRYVMWNAGPGYYAKKNFSPAQVASSVRERAQRYANLRGVSSTPNLAATSTASNSAH
jgi:hypothetical protein